MKSYWEIKAQERKLLKQIEAGEVDEKTITRFIKEANRSKCGSIGEAIQERWDAYRQGEAQ